jgi:hypothetical protein
MKLRGSRNDGTATTVFNDSQSLWCVLCRCFSRAGTLVLPELGKAVTDAIDRASFHT